MEKENRYVNSSDKHVHVHQYCKACSKEGGGVRGLVTFQGFLTGYYKVESVNLHRESI